MTPNFADLLERSRFLQERSQREIRHGDEHVASIGNPRQDHEDFDALLITTIRRAARQLESKADRDALNEIASTWHRLSDDWWWA